MRKQCGEQSPVDWTGRGVNMIIEKVDLLDKQLTCLDCGSDFTFTTGEQMYFWAKGLSEPKRCKSCRMLRKRSLSSIVEVESEAGKSQ